MALSLRSDQIEADGALLLVHGGAWDITNAVLDEHRAGLQEALDTGRVPLHREAGALTVVTETGAALEAHGAFNAGYGAMLNQDGEAELDAGLMAGATLDYGAVVATRRLAHPVRVARRLLTEEGRVRMLAGEVRERVRSGATAEGAAYGALTRMHEQTTSPDAEGATGGCIVVTPSDAAWAFTMPRMARGGVADEEARWAV